VFHAGGLLAIGDCHAAMGDGEATASAVECAVDATFRVTIEERFSVSRPVVATATEVMTTGEGMTMEVATKMARLSPRPCSAGKALEALGPGLQCRRENAT
jgi:acetamidase/formamidase